MANKVEIEIAASTTGMSQIQAMMTSLKNAGQDIAPLELAAKRVSDEFVRLRAQQGVVEQFAQIKAASVSAAAALGEAQAKAQALGQAMAATVAPTQAQSAEFARARAAVNDAKAAYEATAVALQNTRVKMQELGTSTTGLSQQQAAFAASAATASRDLQALNASASSSLASLNALAAAERTASEAATQAGQKMRDAFAVVGVQSVEAINAKIATIRTALETISSQSGLTGAALRNAMAAGNSQIAALQSDIRKATTEMTLMEKAAAAAKTGLSGITVGNLVANGISMIATKVSELGRAFIATNVEADSMRRALTAVYKDAGVAASQMEFLRKSSIASGIGIGDLSNSFTKFSAATKTSGITIQESNAMFSSMTRAAGTLGLSADATGRALSALSQMASKGTVSMEELRLQLGDHIPGALSMAAKGLGITESELVKLVSSGNLAAKDFFPAFTKGLQVLHGETDGLSNTWANFKNNLELSAVGAGNNGALLLMSAALKLFGGALGAALLAVNGLLAGLHSVYNLTVMMADFFTIGFTGALDAFSKKSKVITAELELQSATLLHFIINSEATKKAVENAGKSLEALGTSAAGTTKEVDRAAVAMESSAAKARTSAAGMEAVALATKLAADTTIDAANKWVQLTSEMDKLITAKTAQIKVYEKAAEAADIEGEALNKIAKLTGNNAAILEVSAKAAEKSSVAMEKVAQAREAVAATLAIEIEEMKKVAIAQDGDLKQREQLIIAAQKKLDQAEQEAAASRAAADNARNEAISKDIATQSYRDNSAAVEEYRIKLGAANIELRQAISLESQGVGTKESVTKAQEKAAKAAALYSDALADVTKNLKLNSDQEQQELKTATALLNSTKAQIEGQIALAKSKDDHAKVIQLTIEAKKNEIKIIESITAAQIKEAESAIAVTTAKMKELAVTGNLTAEKRTELVTLINLEKAKITEAETRKKSIDVLKLEVSELAKYTDALNKKIQKMKEESQLRQANSNLALSGLNLRKSEIDAEIKIAEAHGNTSRALSLKVTQKQIEIQIIRETVKAQIAESESSISVAKAKMYELEASGKLTSEKRAEIESSIKTEQAKINEAKAREQNIKVLKDEINTLNDNTKAEKGNASAIDSTKSSLDSSSASRASSASGGASGGTGGSGGDGGRALGNTSADGRFTSGSVNQVDVGDYFTNNQVSGRFGADYVGNADANKYMEMKIFYESYQKSYGAARSAESLAQQAAYGSEMDRLGKKLDAEILAKQQAEEKAKKDALLAAQAARESEAKATAEAEKARQEEEKRREEEKRAKDREAAAARFAKEPKAYSPEEPSNQRFTTPVTINLSGRPPRTINTDKAGADALTALLQDLEYARSNAVS